MHLKKIKLKNIINYILNIMKKNHIYPLDSYQRTLNSFNEKCKENQLWFSLANKSLLSALTQNNYFETDDFIEVFMTEKSFIELQSKYKDFVISPNNNVNFWYTNPFFIEPSSPIVIKIIIIVPADIKKTQKFYNLKNAQRQLIGYHLSNETNKNFWFKTFYSFLANIWSALVWEEIYANIYTEKYQGFFTIDDLFLYVNQNWIPNLTFRMKEVDFLSLTCPIIDEAEIFLTKRYGWDWDKKKEFKFKSFNFNWTKNFIED